MDEEKKYLLMETTMKEDLNVEFHKEGEPTHGQMELYIKVSFSKENVKAKVY